jgi:hypothetical protein
MIDENDSGTPVPEGNEYHTHQDLRRRQKEYLLNAPFISDENFQRLGAPKLHGKHHQRAVQFRISPFAEKVGTEVAALFNLSLSQYSKALLLSSLGLVSERLDRRKKRKWGER